MFESADYAFCHSYILAALNFIYGFNIVYASVFYLHGYKNLYYAYTNKRIIRKGIIWVDYKTLDYTHITASSVNVGFLDKGRHVTTGTLTSQSPTTSIKFNYVENPYNLLREIKEYMNTVNVD